MSSYTGLIGITGADTTVEVDTFIELDTAITDKSLVNMADGAVWLGVHDFGGATSTELFNDAAPTTNATGEIALDITITDHQPLWQYYDGGENMTIIAIDTAQLPAEDNEIIKYDAGTDKFVLEADAGAAGGDSWGDAVDADILPTGNDNTYDLGSAAASFKDIFWDGTATGNVTGALTGNADTVTNATLTTALTVNTGTLTLTAAAANNSVLTIGENAVSVSGANTGDDTGGAGDTYTNAHDFGGADLELPQASPALPDTDGDIELDFTDGTVVIQHGSAHAELSEATDVVIGKLIKSFSGTIYAPDGVNDVITVKAINSIEFPHGVVITAAYLGIASDTTYTLTIQNFDDFDTINAANGTIDTVTYTADTTGEIIDTTPTYATIAAGQIIMISIPATDVDWIHFEIYYYEPAS